MIRRNSRMLPYAAATAKTKNNTIFSSTSSRLPPPPAMLDTTVSATRPSTSSIRAAARIVLPTRVSRCPSSLSVSTVMLTEVAVSTVPKKMFSRKVFPGSQPACPASQPKPVPISMGTSTPHSATKKPAFPAPRSSRRSVPIPAVNKITMTPSSLSWERNAVSDRIFSAAGPRISPASSAPTTRGIWNFPVAIPNSLVLNKIKARSNR